MPSSKRNAAKPPPDSLEVNADGTIDLRIKGEMIYLRCPTVGELQKIVVGHTALLTELSEIAQQLSAYQAATLEHAVAVIAAKDADEPEPERPEIITDDEAQELLFRQWAIVAGYWASEIIPTLTDGAHAVVAEDLPAPFSRADSIGRALRGWYGLPSVPGVG